MQQNGPGDANWTDQQAGQAAAAFGTEADAYQKVAEVVASRPPIDLSLFQRYIALAVQRNKAIAAQMRQLQQAMRTASTPDAALRIWLTKDGQGSKLAQIIHSYSAQTKAISKADPSGASRQSAEFSAPLSNMPGCSDAWRDFSPA